jgi:hypothetical protein
MTDFPLEIQLDVDASAGPFEDVAYRWVDALSAAVIGPERAELAALPATSKIITDAAGPLGPVGTLFGVIEVERARPGRPPTGTKRNLSDQGLAWLRGELADFPSAVKVWVEQSRRDGATLGGCILRLRQSGAAFAGLAEAECHAAVLTVPRVGQWTGTAAAVA